MKIITTQVPIVRKRERKNERKKEKKKERERERRLSFSRYTPGDSDKLSHALAPALLLYLTLDA